MTNITEIILFEHERQITHLHDPNTVRMHYFLYVGHESPRLLQIIEHRDRRDHFGTKFADVPMRVKSLRIKKANDYGISHLTRQFRKILSRIKSDPV